MTAAEDASPDAVARAIATAAAEVADVAGLHHGAVGEFATYGGGRRVGGVRIHRGAPMRVEVHVVARYGRPLGEVATEVRSRVAAEIGRLWPERAGMPVDVRIADLGDDKGPRR